MNRRRIVLTGCMFAGLLLLLAGPLASAATDLYGNVGPGQTLTGIAGRYPLSHYSLDQHFDAVSASLTGGVDASGIPPMIAYFLAEVIWQVTAFLASAVITLFTFAFSLDLLNGSRATGGAGALDPVATAIQGMYRNTFGQSWMVIGVLLAGCWAMWKALVQRRYTETAGALALSLAFCVIALAIVSRPAETIGQVSRWTNEMSTAFLSITTRGDVTGGSRAKQSTADSLHRLLIYEPWAALNFGGTQHCIKTGSGSADSDPESMPVRPLGAAERRRLDAGQTVTSGAKTCINNAARYAPHFLRYPDRSDERNAEYDAVNHGDPGKLPKSDQGTGYRPAVADKPITDAMEKGGQYQRLLLALVIFVGELGVLLLLGALSVSVVLAQVLVLLLACFAPVALVIGLVPGRGHEFFRGWLARLGALLFRKATYSLVLAVLLAVMAALQDASSGLGWLMAFGLQAALAWTVFLQRKQLAGRLTQLVSGPGADREDDALRRVLSLYYGSRIITGAARRLRQHTRPHHRHDNDDRTPPSEEPGRSADGPDLPPDDTDPSRHEPPPPESPSATGAAFAASNDVAPRATNGPGMTGSRDATSDPAAPAGDTKVRTADHSSDAQAAPGVPAPDRRQSPSADDVEAPDQVGESPHADRDPDHGPGAGRPADEDPPEAVPVVWSGREDGSLLDELRADQRQPERDDDQPEGGTAPRRPQAPELEPPERPDGPDAEARS